MTAVVPWVGAADDDEDPVDAEVVETSPPVSLVKPEPVSLVKDYVGDAEYDEEEDDYELEEVIEQPVTKARELALALARPLPSPRQLVARTFWWSRVASKISPWLPVYAVLELRPILRGLGRLVVRWAAWVQCVELAEAIKSAEGNERSKATERYTKRKAARLWGSLITFAILAGGMLWLYHRAPYGFWGAVLVLVAVCDAVGRRGHEGAPVVLPNGPIGEGTSLSTLRAEIVQSFETQGFESVSIAVPMPVQHGWTVDYHTKHAIEDANLRQLEIDLNVLRNGTRQIKDKEKASRGQLHVMYRDPLAEVVMSPEPEALSIFHPLPLGVTASGEEWREHFLRTHFVEVGASQSGKSSCFWQTIDVLRRCPEVELDAIDLTEGPAFGACRRAFRRRAFDEEGAKKILTEAVALCKERNAELNRLAEDDDTPDDYEEKWHPTREHPQRTILIDEFARLAENEELRGLVEYVFRYGAKAAVTVGLASQGGTLKDFGTSIIRAMAMLKILFACTRQDVLDLFGKDARDGGYRPDLFEPANGSSINDAGKCFVMSSMSRTPEPRRSYRLAQAEVRHRDRILGSRHRAEHTVEAVEVPLALAAVERVFVAAGNPERLPTTDLVEPLRGAGLDLPEEGTAAAARLAELLRPTGLRPRDQRWRPTANANPVRGYFLEDVQKAIRSLS